jgi:outer membrane beta-barrel protein
MRIQIPALPLLMTVVALSPMCAAAADEQPAKTQPANEQVIVPQVDRREVKLPRFPSKDFEIGLFAGTYATQNFGSSLVGGLRAGYHVTEDIFVEAVYAQTKVTDEMFRQILPGGIFAQETQSLTYYNLSAGFNVLPGEVFIGRNTAKASALYLIGGIGTTKFAQQNRQTVNFGLGTRVLFWERVAMQIDMREHIFSLDLLGKRQDTKNLELTAGFTLYF